MRSDRKPPSPEDCVVNLAPLAAACQELISWYDRLIAGHQPPIKELDRIVTTLQLLPPTPGRVGRDIQLIVEGGKRYTRDQVIGALERLRSVADHTPAPTPDNASRTSSPSQAVERPRRPRRSKSRRLERSQDHLPGLEPSRDHRGGTHTWRSS